MRVSDKAAVERILKAVSDPENARILIGVKKQSKPAQTISAETSVPLSTVYRKLDELREAGLVMTEHFTVTAGKKVDYLTATFSELRITIEGDRLAVDIIPSDETAGIRWLDLFRGQ